MGQIKDDKEFIDIIYLKNSEALENIKKELAELKIKKQNWLKKVKK